VIGFGDWVVTAADSKNAKQYRKKVEDKETIFCGRASDAPQLQGGLLHRRLPSRRGVIAPFLEDRKEFLNDLVRPL
jgi:hypothetical protein